MNNSAISFNFFLNSLSIHQAPLITKLSESFFVNVYYDYEVSEKRKSLGWEIPNFGGANLIKLDVNNLELHKLKKSNVVNIYSGIVSYKNINHCLRLISDNSRSKNIVQMESINCLGVKGFFRKLKYIYLAKRYNKIVDAYLCQGSGKQFSQLGFKNTYEFGYFLDKPTETNFIENKQCRFIYLGALSKRKQILDVVLEIKDDLIELDIYGSEENVSVKSIEYAIKNSKSINYRGAVANKCVPNLIKGYDYLILPSKTEGWGAVVSEALLSGVGVVVTDSAGIVNYIKPKIDCKIYTYNFDNMAGFSRFLLKLKPLTRDDRCKIISQSKCLTSEYGRETLISII